MGSRNVNADRSPAFVLPPHRMATPEAQDDFIAERSAYRVQGRPHGIAFVWGNCYQDFKGRMSLMVAVDSAMMVAETLQHVGFEVRPRMNMRKRFIMDELSDDNLRDLGKYDTVLVYFSGRGDGSSFYTQSAETVTIQEVWDRFDAAGFRGKARVLIMDLFEMKSSWEEQFVHQIDIFKMAKDEIDNQMELVVERGLSPTPELLDRQLILDAQYKEKMGQRDLVRQPPHEGQQSRIAVMAIPLRAGVAKWSFKVKSLKDAITFGVCDAEGLQGTQGEKMEEYCFLYDFLGSDEFGWSFDHLGNQMHSAYDKDGKHGKQSWGKHCCVEQGDVVTMTLDMITGTLRMDVPGKFKGTATKMLDPVLVSPEERRGSPLYGAVGLYHVGDEVELLELLYGEEDTGNNADLLRFGGARIWDEERSAKNLAFQDGVVQRVDGEDLPTNPDSLYIIHRQPARNDQVAIKGKAAKRDAILGVFDVESTDGEGFSHFAVCFARRIKGAAIADAGVPEDERVSSLSDELVRVLSLDMNRQTTSAWLRSSGLTDKQQDHAHSAMERKGMDVSGIKRIFEKDGLEELLQDASRSVVDNLFRAINEARGDASQSVHSLPVFSFCTFGDRRLLLNGPVLTWSTRHRANSFQVSEAGSLASKMGQSRTTASIFCSLQSTLSAPRSIGSVLSGGGKHSWTWTIRTLRSAQGRGAPAGAIRLGVVRLEAIEGGAYSIAVGPVVAGTTTTVTLGGDLLETDGAYENLHLEIIDGLGKGQSSRIFGYTGGDRTADVILEIAPDFSSSYAITRLSGFEVGDDYHSWALASSAGARSAAMHGETGGATHKTFVFQGKPELVNRVTASGLEHDQTYPRLLGDAVKEGDEVTVFLDLDLELLSFSVNGERLGEAIQGVKGPLVPAASCSSATEVAIQIGGYRRWAPETGWASEENAQDLGFTEGEERQLKALFKRFDPKKTGEIKVSAIAEIFVALEIQMKQSEREDLMDDVDADGSGTLDWIEFLKLMASVKDMGSWNGP